MKSHTKLLMLLLLVHFFSCGNEVSNSEVSKSDASNKSEIATVDEPEAADKNAGKAATASLFVKAQSGLNYRKSPNGEILGKFSLNTEVYIVEYTGLVEEIKDENKSVEGEWVGVKKDNDTVYLAHCYPYTYRYNIINSFIYNNSMTIN